MMMDDPSSTGKQPMSRSSSTSSMSSTSSTSTVSKEKRKSGILSLFNKDSHSHKEDINSNIVITQQTPQQHLNNVNNNSNNNINLSKEDKKKLKQYEKEKERLKEEEKQREKEDEKQRLKEEKQRAKDAEKEREKEREREMQSIKEKLKELKQKEKELKKQQKNKNGEKEKDGTASPPPAPIPTLSPPMTSSNSSTQLSTSPSKRASLDITNIVKKIPFLGHHHDEKKHDKGSNVGDSPQLNSNTSNQPTLRVPLGQHRGSSSLSLHYHSTSSLSEAHLQAIGKKSLTENDLTDDGDESESLTNPPTIIETDDNNNNNNNVHKSPTFSPTSSSSSPSSLIIDDELNLNRSPPLDSSNNETPISELTLTLSSEYKRMMEGFYEKIQESQKNGGSYNPLLERRRERKDLRDLKAMITNRFSPTKKKHPEADHKRSFSTTSAPQDLKCITMHETYRQLHSPPQGCDLSPTSSDSSSNHSSNQNSALSTSVQQPHLQHPISLKTSSDSIIINNTGNNNNLDKRKGILKRKWNTNRLSLTLSRNQNLTQANTSATPTQDQSNRILPFDGTRLKKYLPSVNFRGIGDHLPNFQILPSSRKKKDLNSNNDHKVDQPPTEFKKKVDEVLESFEDARPVKSKISVLGYYQQCLQLQKPVISIKQLSGMTNILEINAMVHQSRINEQLERCRKIKAEVVLMNQQLGEACDSSRIIDSDIPFQLQDRTDNVKPIVDFTLNQAQKLYERSKRLEDNVQILRRSTKTNTKWNLLQNFIVKLFITGWITAIITFISNKWGDGTNINNQSNLNHPNNINNNNNNNSHITNNNNNINNNTINNNNINNVNNNNNNDIIAKGGNMEEINKAKEDKMKVAMSNLEAMTKMVSMMREKDEINKDHSDDDD